jgi:hypothetical protein
MKSRKSGFFLLSFLLFLMPLSVWVLGVQPNNVSEQLKLYFHSLSSGKKFDQVVIWESHAILFHLKHLDQLNRIHTQFYQLYQSEKLYSPLKFKLFAILKIFTEMSRLKLKLLKVLLQQQTDSHCHNLGLNFCTSTTVVSDQHLGPIRIASTLPLKKIAPDDPKYLEFSQKAVLNGFYRIVYHTRKQQALFSPALTQDAQLKNRFLSPYFGVVKFKTTGPQTHPLTLKSKITSPERFLRL